MSATRYFEKDLQASADVDPTLTQHVIVMQQLIAYKLLVITILQLPRLPSFLGAILLRFRKKTILRLLSEYYLFDDFGTSQIVSFLLACILLRKPARTLSMISGWCLCCQRFHSDTTAVVTAR